MEYIKAIKIIAVKNSGTINYQEKALAYGTIDGYLSILHRWTTVFPLKKILKVYS